MTPRVDPQPGSPEDILARLVAETASSGVPDAARAAAAIQVLDAVGVTLAAAAEPAGRVMARVVDGQGGAPEARVIGTRIRTSSVQAAWANGALAHLLDFDDAGFSHPTACIYPAALALAERANLDGRTFLDAMVLGYEVFERLSASGRADEPRVRERGYHPTSIYGAVAAAAAAGRILGLDAAQLVVAFGNAASDASGLTQQFGTWAKGLNAGNAARSGVQAALLAEGGFWGDECGLSGPYGLFAAVHGEGRYDFAGVGQDLGTRWAIVDPGLSIKLYPACGINRSPVDAVLEVLAELGGGADAIDRIIVHIHPHILGTVRFRAPSDGFRGKFSLDYTVAAAAFDGRVDLDTYSDDSANRAGFRDLLSRVDLREHPEWDIARYREIPVEVHLRDGNVIERTVQHPRGTRGNPLAMDDITSKYLACARRVLPADRAMASMAAFLDIANAPSVVSLVDTAA